MPAIELSAADETQEITAWDGQAIVRGGLEAASYEEEQLDFSKMVDIIRAGDSKRKQAQQAARNPKKQKSGAKDNAEKASEPQERPDVDRSGENFANRANTNRKHNTAGAT